MPGLSNRCAEVPWVIPEIPLWIFFFSNKDSNLSELFHSLWVLPKLKTLLPEVSPTLPPIWQVAVLCTPPPGPQTHLFFGVCVLTAQMRLNLSFLFQKIELGLFKAARIGSNDCFNHNVLAINPFGKSFIFQPLYCIMNCVIV